MKIFLLCIFSLSFLWQTAGAQPQQGQDASTLSEDNFLDLLHKIEDEFADDLDANSRQLAIIPVWKSNDFSALSSLDGEFAVITVNGGLARHSKMTSDAVALVVCRELGHFLGGAPLAKNGFSAEGQADYFATTKCLRRVFQDEDNIAIVAEMSIDADILQSCRRSFSKNVDKAICAREVTASVILTNIYKSQDLDLLPVQIQTPDLTQVDITNQTTMPAVQCRLDTLYQGAICDQSANESFSNGNIQTGACNAELGATIGYRPSCWYNPNSVFVAGDLFLR